MKLGSAVPWSRRRFVQACGAATLSVLTDVSLPGLTAPLHARHDRNPTNPVRSANPFVGTGWRGHMFPGAVAPFGMVQLSPDSSGPPDPSWNAQGDWYQWQHCSGYSYGDNIIEGFSHTHLQGTGGIDLGDILVMPLVEGKNWSWQTGKVEKLTQMQIRELGTDSGIVFAPEELGYRSFFSHEKESARPGYYKVHLDTPDATAELTATTRCGMHRYSYPPSSARQGLMVDLAHGLGCRVQAAELTVESLTRITGHRSTHGWAGQRDVYFVLELSRPAASLEVQVDGIVSSAVPGAHFTGTEIRAILAHQLGAAPLVVRVGLSAVSLEGAARNLEAEIPTWDFDRIVQQSVVAWSEALSALETELFDPGLAEAFASDAYHSLVAPATFNDVDGAYRGQDRQNHSSPGFTKYTTLSIWDIYRGQFPFLMLTQPGRVTDIVRTLVLDYEQLGQHSLPMWPLWANETWSMTGFHAAGMILGAYVRGFRSFDAEAAYAAIRDTALNGADARGNRELQAMFRQYGYVPADLHGGSVSQTLDLAYDYWCAGAMAQLLGKSTDAAMFYKLGQSYRNLFNPANGFMQAKDKNGHWRTPFRPDQETKDYVEADAWQASFSVPHDVQGLIELHGGDKGFLAKLDGLFTASSLVLDARPDITGMVGQDAQGDEPSNHHPYLFSFAGAPWKTQYWVRKVAALYNNTPGGIPGNDDCGQLASWFVFATLGFYPVNAANGVYVLGSPLVQRAVIHNRAEKTQFVITADNNSQQNLYIQRAWLNGEEWTRSWISHRQILAGGKLLLEMGPEPNRQWGAAPEDRPPSGLLREDEQR
jgi:predicted alpha-1,2-mannosidase